MELTQEYRSKLAGWAHEATADYGQSSTKLSATVSQSGPLTTTFTLSPYCQYLAAVAHPSVLLAYEAALAAAEARVAELRWVPVSEQLPSIETGHGHSVAVQVWLGDHAANFTAFYCKSGWFRWGQSGRLSNVSHWRQLDAGAAPQQEGRERDA